MLSNHNIEINYKYYEEHGEEELKGIIKHELCHYHLHLEKKGYKHRDADFKNLLRAVGAPRFCSPLLQKKSTMKRKIYVYQCQSCHTDYIRRRKMDVSKYVCGKCRGTLRQVSDK